MRARQAQLVEAFIAGLERAHEGPYSTGCANTPRQITFDKAQVFELGERDGSQECGKLPDRFILDAGVKGVTCLETDSQTILPSCRTIAVAAGTVLRLRPIVRDIHPGGCNSYPFIELKAGCDAPCANPDLMCPTTRVCHDSYEAFRAGCEAWQKEVCACRTETGPAVDGTECMYFASGDTIAGKQCQAGRCIH